MRMTRRYRWPIAAAVTGLLLAGCSLGTVERNDAEGVGSAGEGPKEVVVATHDSWNMDKKVLRDFERRSAPPVRPDVLPAFEAWGRDLASLPADLAA